MFGQSGVPQVLILGPLLFLPLSNDIVIVTDIGYNICLFAYDTNLFILLKIQISLLNFSIWF